MASGRTVLGAAFLAGVAWIGYQAGPGLADFDLDSLIDGGGADAVVDGTDGGCVVKVRPHGGYTSAQVGHARTIAQVGVEEGVGRRGVVIALATAMQESGLANLPYGAPGEDSYGLFQQRPSQGWGTVKQVQTPRHAARSFYRTLKRVDGWRDLPLTVAAQRVQRSAYPDAYAKHEDEAQDLARRLLRKC